MKFRYAPEAIRDLQRMNDYISNVLHNPAAANRINKSILDACATLKQQPFLGGSVREKIGHETDLRFLVREKYLIFYTVDEMSVARIINGRIGYAGILFGDEKD